MRVIREDHVDLSVEDAGDFVDFKVGVKEDSDVGGCTRVETVVLLTD